MIRIATTNDAEAIAALHVRCWQTAYRGYFPDELLDRLSVAERAKRWVAWLADPAQPTAVYDTPTGIDGFVSMGPSRDARAGAATGEVLTIYVEPTRWRRGIGAELLRWAMAVAPAHQWTEMTLWTLAANAGTRAFYERCGWTFDGATKDEPFGGNPVAQVRYAWRCPG